MRFFIGLFLCMALLFSSVPCAQAQKLFLGGSGNQGEGAPKLYNTPASGSSLLYNKKGAHSSVFMNKAKSSQSPVSADALEAIILQDKARENALIEEQAALTQKKLAENRKIREVLRQKREAAMAARQAAEARGFSSQAAGIAFDMDREKFLQGTQSLPKKQQVFVKEQQKKNQTNKLFKPY